MFTFALALTLGGEAVATPSPCAFEREVLLALNQQAFDQDVEGGWRPLADAGCLLEAADLIHDWRLAHASDDHVLTWHEGQMRAMAGQTDRAATLLANSRKPDGDDRIGWNQYVDGTVAFLRGDRAGLERARATLAALPRPAEFALTGAAGEPVAIDWPLNLDVLDRLLACWNEGYAVAYSCPAPPG